MTTLKFGRDRISGTIKGLRGVATLIKGWAVRGSKGTNFREDTLFTQDNTYLLVELTTLNIDKHNACVYVSTHSC